MKTSIYAILALVSALALAIYIGTAVPARAAGRMQDSELSRMVKPVGTASRQRVLRVIDGDTVVLSRGGEKVTCRMIGVGAPETKHPRKPVEFFGPEASAYLRLWIEGKTVVVSYQTNPYKRDRYKRPLVYLWADKGRQCINVTMVEKGYARFESGYPTIYRDIFKAAETKARNYGFGVWSNRDGN